MPKVLARNITRKQALSYEQTIPNRLGVTSLSEVNGRGAYRKRYQQTKRILRGKKTGVEIRPNAEAKVKKNYTKRQGTAMRRMSPAQRAAFAKMLRKSPSVGSVRPRRARSNRARTPEYEKGYEKIFGKGKGKGKKGSPPPVVVTPKAKATKPAKEKAPRVSKKAYIEARVAAGRSFLQAQADWKLKTRKRTPGPRGPRKYGHGKYTPLTAHIGPKKRQTYLYRTRGGKVRRIPSHAIMGYPSAYAEKLEGKSPRGGEIHAKRAARLKGIREKAAARESARIVAGRGIFTPNPARSLSWEEWRSMYEDNRKRSRKSKKGRKGRKLTKAERAVISRRNLKKARAAQRRGGAKRKARRNPSASRYTGNKKKLTKAQRAAISRKNLKKARAARGRQKYTGRFETPRGHKRGRATRLTFPIRGAKTGALTLYRANKLLEENKRLLENKKRRRRRSRKNPSAKILRKARFSPMMKDYGVKHFTDNRRRRRPSKMFRRNPVGNWLDGLKEALKIGGIVVVGYMAHRALTKVIADQLLRKLDAFKDPASGLGKWADVIAGVVVAAAGVPLSVKLIPGESAAVGGGMAASFLHAVIIKALGEAGQGNVASYLSAYPDASAPAYRGIGSYYTFRPHQMMSGMGEYYSQQGGALTYGQLHQAAAGMGQVNPNAIVTQAAAGTGEYLVYGAEGVGEYEEVPMAHMPTAIDEGIFPTLDSAEQALNVMEAAAGVGAAEIPMQSTVYPTDYANPVSDEPSGSRSGVFGGGGGIFGGE